MTIPQRETSPIQDAYDNSHLNIAFNTITTLAGDISVDTDQIKTYCEETVKLLKKFITDIDSIERDITKKKNVENFKEKLFGRDALD